MQSLLLLIVLSQPFVPNVHEDGLPILPGPLDNQSSGADSLPAVQRAALTIHTTTGCQPCVSLLRELSSDPRIKLSVEVDSVPKGVPYTTFPFITFRDAEGVLRYNNTARTADAVLKLIERTNGTPTTTAAQRQEAGAAEAASRARLGAGWHSHTCRVCRVTWTHRDNSGASHNCPKCGRLELRKDSDTHR